MTKNIILLTLAVALIGAAPAIASAKTASNVVGQSDLAGYCDRSDAQRSNDVTLDTGNGNSLAITIHCDAAGKVGMITDTGESEKGPTEAAENGVED